MLPFLESTEIRL